jgi:hypothetical protein
MSGVSIANFLGTTALYGTLIYLVYVFVRGVVTGYFKKR